MKQKILMKNRGFDAEGQETLGMTPEALAVAQDAMVKREIVIAIAKKAVATLDDGVAPRAKKKKKTAVTVTPTPIANPDNAASPGKPTRWSTRRKRAPPKSQSVKGAKRSKQAKGDESEQSSNDEESETSDADYQGTVNEGDGDDDNDE